MNVLIVEDDPETGAFLTRALSEAGWETELHTSPQGALLAMPSRAFDVVIMDRMMPGGMDGVDAVKLLRGTGQDVPVLMLTARSSIADRVEGLEAGADDYLVKPFAISELMARLKILARRPRGGGQTGPAPTAELGPLQLNRLTREVTREGTPLDLSPLEFKLLDYLIDHPGEVVTRSILLERVWGYRFDPKTSLVQTHMSRLRAKLDKPFEAEMIQTVRGSGYRIDAP